jgi:type IV secretion system protein TrbI
MDPQPPVSPTTGTAPGSPGAGKAPPPPLTTRAPRPPVSRIRRSVVAGAVIGACGLLAGAFAWAFVVSPELRAEDHGRRSAETEGPTAGAVRPSEAVTDGPATYSQVDALPPPRRAGGPDEAPPAPGPSARSPAQIPRPTYELATPFRGPTKGANPAEEARRSGLFFGTAGAGAAARDGGDAGAGLSAADRDYAAVYNPHALLAPLSPFELKAGALIPAALIHGIDTARPGPVVATVTQPVFDSVSGRHLLIPQGARLIGRHEGESRYGDRRAFLVWQRLILPNGKSLILSDEAGVDAQGIVGVQGRVDRRLGALAIATLFAGAITTLGTIARDEEAGGGLLGDVGDAAAIEAAEVGGQLIGRELEVRPVIRLSPGAPVRVIVTRDLLLEPYRP